MNVSDIRGALQVLTELVEGAAESVLDATLQSKANDEDYEFIGFASRKNILLKVQPSDEEEAFKLLDMMQAALAQRMAGKAVSLVWKMKPEIIIAEHGMRIGCRLRIKAALVKPKLEIVSSVILASDILQLPLPPSKPKEYLVLAVMAQDMTFAHAFFGMRPERQKVWIPASVYVQMKPPFTVLEER